MSQAGRVFVCNTLSINQICITKLSANPLGCPGAGPFAYRTVRRSQESLQTPVTAEPAVHIALEMKLEWQKRKKKGEEKKQEGRKKRRSSASLEGWNMHLCLKGYVEITRQHSNKKIHPGLHKSKCHCMYFIPLVLTTCYQYINSALPYRPVRIWIMPFSWVIQMSKGKALRLCILVLFISCFSSIMGLTGACDCIGITWHLSSRFPPSFSLQVPFPFVSWPSDHKSEGRFCL